MTQPYEEPANDVVAYGMISLDNIVRVPHPPKAGRPANVMADYYKLGGKVLNSALPLSTWGHRVTLAGNWLGEDPYADFIERELEEYPDIDTRWLVRDARVRTPFSRILMLPDGEQRVLRYWFEEASEKPLTPDMLRGARILSVEPSGKDEEIQAVRAARDAGLLVVASDVVWPEHALLPLCDWIITSRAVLQWHFPSILPEAHLRSLQEARPSTTLIVTDGPEPVLVLTPEGESILVPTYSLPPLDQLGAGELFKAGIIHALLEEMPLLDGVRFANAAGALWVAQPTALKQPPTKEEIRSLQEERGARPPVVEWLQADRTVCPVCHRVVLAALFEKHWQMDRRVVRALRDRQPAWRRADGACPVCVQQTVQQVGLTRATADIPPELAEHPIYSQADPHALPTGVRLRANPHYRGRGVALAFLDSGFYPHQDLTRPQNRILSFVDATTDTIVVDADFRIPSLTSWHGMMTSVVAAGNGFLSQGYYAGLASEAKLLLVKVSNPEMGVHEKDILRGLRWLADHWREYGVQVINLSVGGDPGLRARSELNRLVNRLVEEGLVVVAAAGNAGKNDLCPPASAENAITVGGLDDRNTLDPATNRMWHSNWGRIGDSILKPELIAPSIWVAAPVLPGTPTAEQNLILDRLRKASDRELPEQLAACLHDLGFDPSLQTEPVEEMRLAVRQKLIANKFITPFYQHVDGTSFAAPIVSSVVAQMLEANPSLSPVRVKELLIATAQPLPGVPEYQQGYGVVVPGHAVAAALRERYGSYEPGNLSPQMTNGSIRFIFHEPRAKEVSVIGEWNDWNPQVQPMREREPGVWVTELDRLPAGRYQYKFVVDQAQWLDDPENLMKAVDGYGGFNALLIVA